MADFHAGGTVSNGTDSNPHSRQSSMSSERSGLQNKENHANARTNALTNRDSDEGSVNSAQLILRDGGQLGEESGTENLGFGINSSSSSSGQTAEVPSRQPSSGNSSGTGTARHKVNKTGGPASSIPEVEITIPNDGSLASFSVDAMANFFRSLRLDDRLVSHLHRNGLDGRKFGRLKDSDLDNLRLQNPVIVYFRDRTAPAVTSKKSKQRVPFVL